MMKRCVVVTPSTNSLYITGKYKCFEIVHDFTTIHHPIKRSIDIQRSSGSGELQWSSGALQRSSAVMTPSTNSSYITGKYKSIEIVHDFTTIHIESNDRSIQRSTSVEQRSTSAEQFETICVVMTPSTNL